MPKQTAQFWAGKFETESLFKSFFEEHYSEDDDDAPISRFAESQGKKWIDHDFLEIGFENSDVTIGEKFALYSHSDKWIEEFNRRLNARGINDVNTLVMCNFDGNDPNILSPKSFSGPGFAMEYLGTIAFEYQHPDWFQKILNG